MNSYYTFVFFAFILLFSSSSLAYRMFANTDDQDQDQQNILVSRRMILVPSEVIHPGSKYILPSHYQSPDRKLFKLDFINLMDTIKSFF